MADNNPDRRHQEHRSQEPRAHVEQEAEEGTITAADRVLIQEEAERRKSELLEDELPTHVVGEHHTD